MSDNLRQRRGKKSSSAATSPASETTPRPSATATTDAAKNNENGDQQELSPIEQLRSARARLAISRDRTSDLHVAWKGQLFLLSLLVVLVTMHQLQTSISSCIREIKEGDGKDDGSVSAVVTGAEAVKLIFGDSYCEILGVVISSLLSYFLALSKVTVGMLELDNWSYMLSSALVPITLGLYFHTKHLGCFPGGGEDDIESAEAEVEDRHQFPVVVIYHTIVTIAFWFMKSGMQQCEEHVNLVDDSIQDFARMDEKMKLKKQLKSRARRK